MTEFEVGGHTYRSGKIPAMSQAHLIRRLTPALGALRDLAVRAGEVSVEPDADTTKLMVKAFDALEPITKVVGQMPDADFEYVVNTCLGACERRAGAGWQKVWDKDSNSSMFDDIDVAAMIYITVNVLKDSLAPFVLGLASAFGGKD